MIRKIYLITILALLSSSASYCKVLDKVVGVINDKVITLSELNRIKQTIPSRREISPIIYEEEKYTEKDILKIIFNTYIIKDKLSSLGYIISDDKVEGQIKTTEKRNGLRREDLLDFLKSKNFSFDEYFNIIRSTLEYNLFNRQVIGPLVSITDQEIKNLFYKQNAGDSSLAFNYELVDFYIHESKVLKSDLSNFSNILKNYRSTGYIPKIYSDLDTIDLGHVSEDDLDSRVVNILKEAEEGNFSKPLVQKNHVHVYFLKKKNLIESSKFLANKNKIRAQLFKKNAKSFQKSWFDKEKQNYYIQVNL